MWVSEGEGHTDPGAVTPPVLVPSGFTLYLSAHFYFGFLKSDTFKIKIDIFSPLIIPEENKC